MEFSYDILISLLILTGLEIVLGIDNIIFISILAAKLPQENQEQARKLGLIGALVTRLLLLGTISYLTKLTTPLFEIFSVPVSGKSLILLVGGLFLMYKSTKEIHDKLEGDEHKLAGTPGVKYTLAGVITQIMLLDIVFSIDSVVTAVGMANQLWVMVAANVIALMIMLGASGGISRFVDRHPTIKMLALTFLMMIGLVLVSDAVGFHIPKGYVYFAMAFSVLVEMLNIRTTRGHPSNLKKS